MEPSWKRVCHLDVQFELVGSRLIATVSGINEPDEAVFRFQWMLDACRSGKVGEVLIDYRDLKGHGSAVQEIIYATRIVDLYRGYLLQGGRPLRLAYVGNDAFVGGWVPGAEIAGEAGLDVIVTTSLDEAVAWLDRPLPASLKRSRSVQLIPASLKT